MEYGVPMEEVDQFGKPVPVIDQAGHVVETDYRIFRYSKFALPWLIFMMLMFFTLLLLTFWQGGFGNIKFIRDGVPRDLEPFANSDRGDGGLNRKYRNVRFAAAILSIVAPVLVAIIYYANPRPKLQRIFYLGAVVILVFAVIMSIIAFCLDVSNTRKIQICRTEPRTMVQTCENRAAYLVVCVALDAMCSIVGFISIIMLAMWSKDDSLKRSKGFQQNNLEFVEDIEMKPIIPGQDIVHKSLIGLALLALLVSAILLLNFTIYIHEFRERVTGPSWDGMEGQSQSGWPKENTRLRLSVTIISICLVFLSFVPYPKRVYVYVLSFFFLICTSIYFVIFAMDVKDLESAKKLKCPPNLRCMFHPYNTVCVFDFLCGTILIIYLAYEFILKHKQSTVTVQRDIGAAPLEEFVSPYDAHPDYLPVIKPDGTRQIEGPALRPLLGVEVIEVEHPATAELNVTVMNVTPGGAAEEAGLRVGDIIARWDEIPITCKADFAQAVSNASIGSQVVLQVIRQAQHHGMATATSIEYCRLTVRGVPA